MQTSNTPTASKALTTWADVARALQDDDARGIALGRYRAAGFKPDDFERKKRARAAMADGLTAAEDAMELRCAPKARAAIRQVRRRLELELWP
jgi:hypothetical protein